ncbi:hypothetical protein B484DRAFT_454413 [Ochromonadaceae sp. CCMP2298]|nr:hypothetical protein B484DRAFT_454413 [Ochromonadaceae sp. CCMP2298]
MNDAYLLAFSLSAAYLEVGDTLCLLAASKQLGSLGGSIHQINVSERVTWNDAAIRAVGGRFPNIHGLSVAGKAAPCVLDLSASYLSSLSALRVSGGVVLAGDTADNANRRSGARLCSLREMHLYDVMWTEADLVAATTLCGSLVTLTLSRCIHMPLAHVTALVRGAPGLRELRLSHCFTDRGALQLAPNRLRELRVQMCPNITGAVYASVEGADSAGRTGSLRVCDISGGAATGPAVQALLRANPHLEHLRAQGCVSIAGALELCGPYLYSLSLQRCSRITSLSLRCPALRRLDLSQLLTLRQIALQSCLLAVLDLGMLPELERVTLDCPALRRLDISGCANLGAWGSLGSGETGGKGRSGRFRHAGGSLLATTDFSPGAGGRGVACGDCSLDLSLDIDSDPDSDADSDADAETETGAETETEAKMVGVDEGEVGLDVLLDVSLSRLLLEAQDAHICNSHNDISLPTPVSPTSGEAGAVLLVVQLLKDCPLLDVRYLIQHCGGSSLHPHRNQILAAFAPAEVEAEVLGVQIGAGAGGCSGQRERGMLGRQQRRSPRCAGAGVTTVGQGRMSGGGGVASGSPKYHTAVDIDSGKKRPRRRRSSV